LQGPAVRLAQPLETPLDLPAQPSDRVAAAGLSSRLFVRKEVTDQGGNQGAREEVRGEHREDDRQRQRDEERFRHSGDERHGKEDDADTERRDERRNPRKSSIMIPVRPAAMAASRTTPTTALFTKTD